MRMNGPTKFFFDDPATDRLLSMVMTLGAEVAALREELHTIRTLLSEKGAVTAEEIANHIPSAPAQAERDSQREALVANLLFPLQQECQSLLDAAETRGGKA